MKKTRYRTARTLIRSIRPLPGESKSAFKAKVKQLRKHFEQFNLDVSQLCQWLMGMRPGSRHGNSDTDSATLWQFMLSPTVPGNTDATEDEADQWRREVFDVLIGESIESSAPALVVNPALKAAVKRLVSRRWPQSTGKCFARLRTLEPSHRLVILKAAAEWVYSRYQKSAESIERRKKNWEDERDAWERRHPELTKVACGAFTDIFKVLDPGRKKTRKDGSPEIGVRSKRPRICAFDKLMARKDDCEWAGQRYGSHNHHSNCVMYARWVKKDVSNKKFADYLSAYLKAKTESGDTRRALQQKWNERRERLQKKNKKTGKLEFDEKAPDQWFNQTLHDYLNAFATKDGESPLTEATLIARYRQHGKLPHCTDRNGPCQFNEHTELCKQYRSKLMELDDATRKLEPKYREWRRDYLAGPKIPTFKYPSASSLPTPKIFGKGYFEVDMQHSRLKLRPEGLERGQWLEFAFNPWPKKYKPSANDVVVTSIHVNFVGQRARPGFRFEVAHKASIFGISQDRIDELRSTEFSRQSQDQEFLDAARAELLASLQPGFTQDQIRVLAVDVGEKGDHAAVYQGRDHIADIELPMLKLERLKEDDNKRAETQSEKTTAPAASKPPVIDEVEARREARRRANPAYRQSREVQKPLRERVSQKQRAEVEKEREKRRGLTREHYSQHLVERSGAAAALTDERAAHLQKQRQLAKDVTPQVTVGRNDLRSRTIHMRWMIRDWARDHAYQIMQAAENHKVDLIVMESQRGFTAPGRDTKQDDKNRKLDFFAWGMVRRRVREKAVERGMRFVTVPYLQSSKYCSKCGADNCIDEESRRVWKKNKEGSFKGQPNEVPSKFVCNDKKCGNLLTPEGFNAARVLARVFLGEMILPVDGRDSD